jgi:hypothetical protein
MRTFKVVRAELLNPSMLLNNQTTIPNDHFPAEVRLMPGFLVVKCKNGIVLVPESQTKGIKLEEDPTAEQQPKPAQSQPQQQGKR